MGSVYMRGGGCVGGSAVLAVSKGKEFPKTRMGGCGSVVWFINDVQLRGFLS